MPPFDIIFTFLTNFFSIIIILTTFIVQKLSTKLVLYNRQNNSPPKPLPVDCLIEILEYLENDTSSLHSCILVNRLWCFFATRILWRRPFENVYPDKYGLSAIGTYISCLSDEEKQFFINYDVDVSFLVQPLLDYPRYLQRFDCEHFILSVRAWLNSVMIDDIPDDDVVHNTV